MLTENQTVKNNRYCIKSPLGRNANGVYYEAFDRELNKAVLLKEIPESLNKVTTTSDLESLRSSFAESAKTLCGIKHQTLLQVQDYFSEVDHHYLVIEKKEGKTLNEIFDENQNSLPFNDVMNWAVQILEALSYLHSNQTPIFHLDINPANLILTEEGNIILKTQSIIQQLESKKETVLADEQFDAEHLAFLPLEQIWEFLDSASQNLILNNLDEDSQKYLEKPLDGRSDLYSLGATLYYLLTAHLPFDSLTRLMGILDGKEDPLPAPNEINPNIPHEISDILLNTLEIQRENRYSSATILKQILRTTLTKVNQRENVFEKETSKKEEPTTQILKPESRIKENQTTFKPIDEDQKEQLEAIKRQLREAEERRLAAEQRAAEAERLLREKDQEVVEENELFEQQWLAEEEFIEENKDTEILGAEDNNIEGENIFETDEVFVAENELGFEFESNILDETEIIEETDSNVQNELSSETKLVYESEEIADLNVETEPQTQSNYFDELYEKEENPKVKNKRSYVKVAGVGLLLTVLAAVGFGFWNFYDADLWQNEFEVSNDKAVQPIKLEETSLPTLPEIAEEQITDENPLVEPTPVEQNVSVPIQPTPVPTVVPPVTNNKTPIPPTRKNVPPVKPNVPAKTPKPAPTKKPVTLDDLLEDG